MEKRREAIIALVTSINDLGLMVRLYNLLRLFARHHGLTMKDERS